MAIIVQLISQVRRDETQLSSLLGFDVAAQSPISHAVSSQQISGPEMEKIFLTTDSYNLEKNISTQFEGKRAITFEVSS